VTSPQRYLAEPADDTAPRSAPRAAPRPLYSAPSVVNAPLSGDVRPPAERRSKEFYDNWRVFGDALP